MIDIAALVQSPLLGLIGRLVPQAAPVIEILRIAAPAIKIAQPMVAAAIAEGKPAFDAAVKAAPHLKAEITSLFAKMKMSSAAVTTAGQDQTLIENITRELHGFHRMTQEEEARWMDAATPHNPAARDPSQEGSG